MHGQGMASSDFSGVTILLPKEAGLTELAEQINGAWQKDCSLFFSVEEVPQEEFDKRLAAGSYTIALAPIRAEGGSVYQMLQQFTAEGGGLTGWSDPIYSQRLAESAQQTGSAAVPCWPIVSASCWKAAPWCRCWAEQASTGGGRHHRPCVRPLHAGAGPNRCPEKLTFSGP